MASLANTQPLAPPAFAVQVKIALPMHGELRKIFFPAFSLTHGSLVTRVSELFGTDHAFRLSYVDADGDKVCLIDWTFRIGILAPAC